MDYQTIYNKIVTRGKTLGKYNMNMERHHIIPRCMGGDNSDENLVYLTPREHFIAHQLLVKINKGHVGLIKSAAIMSKKTKFNHRHCSKQYEWLRIKSSEANRIISKSKRGKKRSDQDIQKMVDGWNKSGNRHESVSEQWKQYWSDESNRKAASERMMGIPKSEEMKKKMSIVASNRSEIHKKRLAESLRGKKMSKETIEKIKLSKKNAPEGVCPHCGKIGKMMGGFVSWHFDNCRSKK